jgi:hypothetical protein
MTEIQYLKYGKSLRLIKAFNNRVYCRSLFGHFKILTVTSVHVFEKLCCIETSKSDIHKHNTKWKQNLYIQLWYTARRKKSVINVGTKLHNDLPFELKRIENCKVFKNMSNIYLLENCSYSQQETFSKNCRRQLVVIWYGVCKWALHCYLH